jgi:endoglucanase
MKDCLDLWYEAGWGWALWNLRGPFGVVDSGREDVTYEDFNGHKLDREVLELLRKG